MNVSQPLFVFAVLLTPYFNVLADYFCFTQFGGSFHSLNCNNFVTQLL